jgi:1-aminocyclopropane-1-carboxylate deaminase/D-cysteine desulfhydrase-like pyridoxal-dependent ACC family enzyme
MLFPTSKINIQKLSDSLFDQKEVTVSVLRLDKLHAIVSGNKLFKLHYFLEKAKQQCSEGIITFGGPYSNHLVATAFASKEIGLKSIGIIRGEQPKVLSHTLQACLAYGMELKFITRHEYDQKEKSEFLAPINCSYPKYLIIPEGGYGTLGAKGAAMIMDWIPENTTHICCAIGTATTFTGLLKNLNKDQQLIGFPVLKNMNDIEKRIQFLSTSSHNNLPFQLINSYHFGGYAKKNNDLIAAMNLFYEKYQLPTDFVYTAKMMVGVIDCISKDFFKKGSNILCIHTGGLQGNLSLEPGTLKF